ncbi:hypothetical protein K2173_019137 [Erythroxylum novogranatense]|uniref:S1 motif domain-containing protein n=1 Tax=Erythroxylum novogranatense TaxID=1862640 RepID=A0AAV8SU16_9ROSI|nr:hypothetical protein K2173_019137 [Erythroxylum novogranatense]
MDTIHVHSHFLSHFPHKPTKTMLMLTAIQGSVRVPSFSHLFCTYTHSSFSSIIKPPQPVTAHFNSLRSANNFSRLSVFNANVSDAKTVNSNDTANPEVVETSLDDMRQARRSADWEAIRAYLENGSIFEGRVEGCNAGGLLVRFYSLLGFLPFPQLSPSHTCKAPQKSIHEIAEALTGTLIPVKVIQADEENRRLIFSEKEAVWTRFSEKIQVGDAFVGRVGAVEDYGAFVHLRFPDGLYHLTGLVHLSEVSWDLIQDVRDILNEGDQVRVKVINIDRHRSRIALSIKQLEQDPLLETLDKVIQQDGSVGSDSLGSSQSSTIEPLPGLEEIIQELLREDGIDDIRINKQGFEKRVVSQDLQLWLSNAPPVNRKFTLLARAGRQVQEIQLITTLDQEGIKKALQRVLERVP